MYLHFIENKIYTIFIDYIGKTDYIANVIFV